MTPRGHEDGILSSHTCGVLATFQHYDNGRCSKHQGRGRQLQPLEIPTTIALLISFGRRMRRLFLWQIPSFNWGIDLSSIIEPGPTTTGKALNVQLRTGCSSSGNPTTYRSEREIQPCLALHRRAAIRVNNISRGNDIGVRIWLVGTQIIGFAAVQLAVHVLRKVYVTISCRGLRAPKSS